jgi:hypothetical protein
MYLARFFILFNSLVFLVCGLCVVSDDKTEKFNLKTRATLVNPSVWI